MITEKTFIDKTKAVGWEEEIICEQREFLGVKKKKKRISKPKSSMEAVKSEQRTDTEK